MTIEYLGLLAMQVADILWNMLQIWRNLSVVKKLYAVVGLMALLIATELFTLFFAMSTLSAVRAFVGGEGMWSKAQKDATNALYLYAFTHDEKEFLQFQNALKINYGDRKARLEMMKTGGGEFPATEAGFLEGGVDRSDIPGVVKLIHRFHEISYVNRAIQAWMAADSSLDELVQIGNEIHNVIISGKATPEKLKQNLARLNELNVHFTVIENEFSDSLSEGSRWMEKVVMIALLFAALTVECTGLLLTIFFSRNLSRSLGELNLAAQKVGQGDFSETLPIRSQDELGQLAMAINKMTEDLKKNVGQRLQAENANQIKSMFLANMSHEIRTPLGIIIGMTEILKEPNLPQVERDKYISIIERTGKSLSQIINDILDLTKVETGHLEIHKAPLNLQDLLAELKQMMNLKAEQGGNVLSLVPETECPKEIFSDRTRLLQILINLTNNALKFTHHGQVSVLYGLENNQLYFKINDTGIGISDEEKKRLFQSFSQLDSSSTRKYEGTGLGLVLSQKLAQLMGGDVALIRSVPGQGSTFKASVMAVASAEEALHSAANEKIEKKTKNRDLEGKRILVVDDSPDNQLLIEHLLHKMGAHLEFAENGQVALDKVALQDFDLILMDMQMPIVDGYTATKILRERGVKVPIIAVTAHAMVKDRNRCLEVGCDEYLTKPIDAHRLHATIAEKLKVS